MASPIHGTRSSRLAFAIALSIPLAAAAVHAAPPRPQEATAQPALGRPALAQQDTATPAATGTVPAPASATVSPTSTPTVTPTATPSATTTSTFGQWQGAPTLVRPDDGAELPQPIDGEEWRFEWTAPNHGICGYNGALVTLLDPLGWQVEINVRSLSYVHRAEHPVPAGPWSWYVRASCIHGPTSPSERRTFIALPEERDPPAATVFLPYLGRGAPSAGMR